MVKWVKMGYGYFEEFGLPNIPEDDREKVEKFLDAAMPLVERMDKANREMLIPALADGQVGPGDRRQAQEQALHQDAAGHRKAHADDRAGASSSASATPSC